MKVMESNPGYVFKSYLLYSTFLIGIIYESVQSTISIYGIFTIIGKIYNTFYC